MKKAFMCICSATLIFMSAPMTEAWGDGYASENTIKIDALEKQVQQLTADNKSLQTLLGTYITNNVDKEEVRAEAETALDAVISKFGDSDFGKCLSENVKPKIAGALDPDVAENLKAGTEACLKMEEQKYFGELGKVLGNCANNEMPNIINHIQKSQNCSVGNMATALSAPQGISSAQIVQQFGSPGGGFSPYMISTLSGACLPSCLQGTDLVNAAKSYSDLVNDEAVKQMIISQAMLMAAALPPPANIIAMVAMMMLASGSGDGEGKPKSNGSGGEVVDGETDTDAPIVSPADPNRKPPGFENLPEGEDYRVEVLGDELSIDVADDNFTDLSIDLTKVTITESDNSVRTISLLNMDWQIVEAYATETGPTYIPVVEFCDTTATPKAVIRLDLIPTNVADIRSPVKARFSQSTSVPNAPKSC